MSIILLSDSEIDGLSKFGIVTLLVKTDNNQSVIAEIGLDADEIIVHKFPGDGKYGRYGILEGTKIISKSPEYFLSDKYKHLFDD